MLKVFFWQVMSSSTWAYGKHPKTREKHAFFVFFGKKYRETQGVQGFSVSQTDLGFRKNADLGCHFMAFLGQTRVVNGFEECLCRRILGKQPYIYIYMCVFSLACSCFCVRAILGKVYFVGLGAAPHDYFGSDSDCMCCNADTLSLLFLLLLFGIFFGVPCGCLRPRPRTTH